MADPAVEFKCEPCKMTFASNNSLNQHYLRAYSHRGIWVKCGLCSAASIRKSNLAKHYHDKHHDIVGNGMNYAENQLNEISTRTVPPAEPVNYAQASKDTNVIRPDDKHTSEYKYYLQATPTSNVFELYVKMANDNPVVYDFEWKQLTSGCPPCCSDGVCQHTLIERIGNSVTKSKLAENAGDPSIGSNILWLIVQARNEGIIIDTKLFPNDDQNG